MRLECKFLTKSLFKISEKLKIFKYLLLNPFSGVSVSLNGGTFSDHFLRICHIPCVSEILRRWHAYIFWPHTNTNLRDNSVDLSDLVLARHFRSRLHPITIIPKNQTLLYGKYRPASVLFCGSRIMTTPQKQKQELLCS